MSVTNLDPKPYRCDRHCGRWGDDQTCYTCVDEHGVTRPTHDGSLCVYHPRPKFDVGDNPILEAFAAGLVDGRVTRADATDYLRALSPDQWTYASDQANIELNAPEGAAMRSTADQLDRARTLLALIRAEAD